MLRHRILVVDGDPVIRRFIRANLEARGYDTFLAIDAVETIRFIENDLADLVIIDLMSPHLDGLELCRRISETSKAFIIVLIDQSNESYKIKCLKAGADEYILKPFGIDELIARVQAILRRREGLENTPNRPIYSSGNLEIILSERRVLVGGHEVNLTPIEYNLLQELALNKDKVLSHDLLLNKIWGPEYRDEREYLRVFVGRLRKKLEPDPKKPRFIITVPWVGYKLNTVTLINNN